MKSNTRLDAIRRGLYHEAVTLQGKVALVTGGARRVGRTIALALAKRGAHVAITYRTSAAEARQTTRDIERLAVRAVAIRADVSRAADVKRLIAQTVKQLGGLDVLVNNAAVFFKTPWKALTERDWDRTLDANLKGPFLCTLAAGRVMQRHGGGKIINIADWAGIKPYNDYLPYCVSKAGVIALTKAAAKALAPTVQVVAIGPGPVALPEDLTAAERARILKHVPLKRLGSPQDIANTVVFLVEGTDYMTGSMVLVDGGQLIA